MKVFVAGVLAALAVSSAHAEALPRAEFDAYVEALREDNAIPGLALAVIDGGRIVKLAGYGFADLSTRRPMTADTPMNVASISKPVLGLEVLRLAERGQLDLDADVNRYLPFRLDNPKVAGEVVTLRHLATHTSGVVDVDGAGESPTSERPWPLADYLASMLTPGGAGYRDGYHFRNATPGEVREYSNMGARIAGLAAERAGGASLRDLMAREVFRPLGLKQTSWEVRDFAPGVLAIRYDARPCPAGATGCVGAGAGTRWLEATPHNEATNYPDGGLQSSAHDLATLTLGILDGGRRGRYRLLAPATAKAMLQPQLADPKEARQRFFWRERDGLIGHAGSDVGVYTSLYFDPVAQDAVIVLMNRTPDLKTEVAMGQLIAKVRATYFGPP